MLKVFALLWIVWTVVLKYFGSPRGVSSKNLLAEETKMEHWEIISSTLAGLRESKKTDTPEEHREKVTNALKVVKAQYKKVVETLEAEMTA